MEKFGLVDKTKDELIDIALEKDATEKELRTELENVNVQLARTENELKRSGKSICKLCVVCIMLMASVAFLLLRT